MTDQPDKTSRNKSNEHSEGLRRRDVIKGAAAAGLSITAGVNLLPNAVEAAPASQPVSQNVIQRENARPGTRDWLLTKTRTLVPWQCGSQGSGKKKTESGTTTQSPAPKRRSQEEFFKSRDRNADGVITLKEYIGNPKDRNIPALTTRFKKIDSNGDGKLQLGELKKQTK